MTTSSHIRIEVLDVEEFAITQVLLQLDPEAGITPGDDNGDGVSDHQPPGSASIDGAADPGAQSNARTNADDDDNGVTA